MHTVRVILLDLMVLWAMTNLLGGVGAVAVIIWYRSRYSARGGRTS